MKEKYTVVDSAAEIAILSDKVYQALTHKPPKLREVTLLIAGRKMAMKGFVAGPVGLKKLVTYGTMRLCTLQQ